jgi:ceramide glucosyltransferase
VIDFVAFASATALVALAWRVHRSLSRALDPQPPPSRLEHYPSVTVIRPIKGLDAEVEENLRAGLDHGYPGEVETLFVFDDAEEPVVPLVHQAVADYRAAGGRDRIEVLYCGAPPPGRTGKLNAMIHGLRRARGDLVAYVDSDVRADRDTLRVTVETLVGDPKAGSAAAPVVVTPRPRNPWDAASNLLLNGFYSPTSRLMARRHGGALPFIMGQFMVLRREALLAIGNLEDVAGNFVDDIQIGQHVERAGFRNRLTVHPVSVIWEGVGFAEFVQNFRRWMTFSRGFPWVPFKWSVAWRVSVFFAGVVGALGFAAAGHGAAALAWLAPAAAVNASIARLNQRIGGHPLAWRHVLAPSLVLLVIPWVFARVYTQKHVEWRGRVYDLDPRGRLRARP